MTDKRTEDVLKSKLYLMADRNERIANIENEINALQKELSKQLMLFANKIKVVLNQDFGEE